MDYENLSLIATALRKCGLLDEFCEIPPEQYHLCKSYIDIDGKESRSERFDSLCKRLMEHFLPGFDPSSKIHAKEIYRSEGPLLLVVGYKLDNCHEYLVHYTREDASHYTFKVWDAEIISSTNPPVLSYGECDPSEDYNEVEPRAHGQLFVPGVWHERVWFDSLELSTVEIDLINTLLKQQVFPELKKLYRENNPQTDTLRY